MTNQQTTDWAWVLSGSISLGCVQVSRPMYFFQLVLGSVSDGFG